MKIEAVNYMGGGMSLEIIAETEVEYALLKEAWHYKEMRIGNGRTITSKGSQGFYVTVSPQPHTRKTKEPTHDAP